MPAYLIAQVQIHDWDVYREYAARATSVIARYGGRILARGGATEVLEGPLSKSRVVIVEFASMRDAKRFYDSPEYQAVRKIREPVSAARIVAVDGVEQG